MEQATMSETPNHTTNTGTTNDNDGHQEQQQHQRQRKRRISKKERKALKKKPKPDNNHHDSQVNTGTTDSSYSEDKTKIIEQEITQIDEDMLEKELMKSYKAIPIPTKLSSELQYDDNTNTKREIHGNDDEGGTGEKRLGAWFPNALLVKCSFGYTNTGKLLQSKSHNEYSGVVADTDTIKPSGNTKSSLVLFYQYTNKEKKWTQHQVKLLMTYLSIIGKQRNLGGRIRVAQEGVNATLSAVDMPYENGSTAKKILRHVAQDLKNFDGDVFAETDFKFIDDLSADRHFKELKIIPVQELVYYGIRDEDASCNEGGVHLDAIEYHKMLQKENTVVIDVRNHYECILGRFDGQQQKEESDESKNEKVAKVGAEYIDPKMRKSTDFTTWLAQPETKKKLENKTVLMYCTGGIRCERASAYLKKEMGNDVEGVYQLKGGIERYLKAFPSGGFWRGSNFVFDKREAVSSQGKDGCGGVIRKSNKNSKQGKNTSSGDDGPSKCCVCNKNWDRYVGKKKCYTCGVPVLMCDHCMSQKPDKKPELMLKVRCPLCIEENITIPASKIEFTDNGVKSKMAHSNSKDYEQINSSNTNGQGTQEKAASSICKWGGGHAKEKKFARKMKQTPCRFGKECVRKDCFFSHPS